MHGDIYHQGSEIEIDRGGREELLFQIADRLFENEGDGRGRTAREELLAPSRHLVRLGQETLGDQDLIVGDCSIEGVLGKNVPADKTSTRDRT